MRQFKSIHGSQSFKPVLTGFILLLPLVILIPGWEGFVYSPRSNYSDITISHFPNALYLLHSLSQGQFPLWGTWILGGYPFAADPLSGLWYLPGWIAYLFPLPLGFNLNVLIHIFFGGIGMFLFLQAIGQKPLASLGGALAWELLPKTFAHFGAGHLTLVYAISWTPWLLLFETKRKESRYKLLCGLVLGLIALADIRWTAYAGLTWAAFSLWRTDWGKNVRKILSTILDWGFHFLKTVLFALLIAAPQLLPLIEFTRLSTRSNLRLQDNFALSLSPLHLFGLVAPNFQGYAEWTVYAGSFGLIAFLWSLTHPKLRKDGFLWLIVAFVTICLSLGEYFPPNELLMRLPGWDLLRVPSRFMVICGMAFSILLARFLDYDFKGIENEKHFWSNLLTFGIAVFTWVIVIGLWMIDPGKNPPWVYVWGAVFLSGTVAWIGLHNSGRISQNVFLIGAIVWIVLDIGATSQSEFSYRNKDSVLGEKAELLPGLLPDDSFFRIYSPSYSLPQQTAAANHLETINGIDPLQLNSFIEFMQTATGVAMTNYSVTVPPFITSDPATDNREAVPDGDRLGSLNVRYVLAEYPMQAAGLNLIKKIGDTYIYENSKVRPRAWVQPLVQTETATLRPAKEIQIWANRVNLKADGPGLLVLSEINYPGWEVRVDGAAGEVETIDGLFRGVQLSAGSHEIDFIFRPTIVYLAIGLAAAGWILLFTRLLVSWRSQ